MIWSSFKIVASFFLFFAHIFANEQAISLEYSIRPLIKNEKSILEVCLTFQGNKNGITEILLPSSWAGQNNLYDEITELRSLSSQARIEDTAQPEIKKIYHSFNEPIQIVYHVISKEKQDFQWFYRPVMNQSYFFFIGHCFFIIPKIDDRIIAHISLVWQDFPLDFALANSFGVQKYKQELVLPLAEFLHAVYTGGDFQILQCGDQNTPIFVAIRGKWSFSNERFTNLIQTVIESHRRFWNDFDFPFYLVTILPTGNNNYLGGTGLSNSFSIFIGDLSDEKKEDWKMLAWLLSHEHFHTWNGTKMMTCPPEGSLYWFTEGFTEYYAVKLNYKSQLIDINDYLKHMNGILYDYYTSSVHNVNNERIQNDFWNNKDVYRLPYVRGFLFALQWDRKIQDESKGQHTLDDFMVALLKQIRDHKSCLSPENIERAASFFLPLQKVRKDIQKYIIEGETILPEENFEKVHVVKWTEHLGFNIQQTKITGKIQGVKQDSKAFDAGLKNGQKFISYKLTDQIISVSIVDQDGNSKEITYLKDPIPLFVPQYVQEHQLQK